MPTIKTKEQIIDDAMQSDMPEPGERCVVTMNEAYRAMDQYAEQESMSFAEWVGQEVNPFLIRENDKWVQSCGNSTEFPTNELYQLYKQSKP